MPFFSRPIKNGFDSPFVPVRFLYHLAKIPKMAPSLKILVVYKNIFLWCVQSACAQSIVIKTFLFFCLSMSLESHKKLCMGATCDMQEEGNSVVALFPAHVAFENIIVAMVTHVNGIQDVVFERNITKLTFEYFLW